MHILYSVLLAIANGNLCTNNIHTGAQRNRSTQQRTRVAQSLCKCYIRADMPELFVCKMWRTVCRGRLAHTCGSRLAIKLKSACLPTRSGSSNGPK